MIGYVYVIRNSVNDKVYVGISKQLKVRWDCHRRSVVKGKSKLYSAMRKHGFDKFSIEPFLTILDYDKYCDELEIETIELFNSFKNGYNSTKGGEVGFLDNPRTRIDYVGQKFGRMTVLQDLPDAICSNGRYNRMVKCRCDCGNERDVTLAKLKNGHTESCGCIRLGLTNHKYVDVIGQVFGDLTIIDDVFPSKPAGRRVKCMCTCGKIKTLTLNSLRTGKAKSCGGASCVVDGVKYDSLSEAATALGYKTAGAVSKILSKFEDRGFLFHPTRKTNYNPARLTPVVCVETGDTFVSCTAASLYMKDHGYVRAAPSKISACAKGERKSAYGYHWKFLDTPPQPEV